MVLSIQKVPSKYRRWSGKVSGAPKEEAADGGTWGEGAERKALGDALTGSRLVGIQPVRTACPCESIDTHMERHTLQLAIRLQAFRAVSCEVAFEVLPLQPDRVSLGVAGQGSLKTASG